LAAEHVDPQRDLDGADIELAVCCQRRLQQRSSDQVVSRRRCRRLPRRWIALRNFKGQKSYSELFSAIRNSKDPPSFMVLFEDSASLIGLAIAFIKPTTC
jgi:hypothetical protein